MIPVLRHTARTRFDRIAPGGFRILSALDRATSYLGHDIFITAGTNDHTVGRHPLGEAFDVRVLGLDVGTVIRLIRFLKSALPESHFTILYETPIAPAEPELAAIAFINPQATGPHLHIQVRRNTDYPVESAAQENV